MFSRGETNRSNALSVETKSQKTRKVQIQLRKGPTKAETPVRFSLDWPIQRFDATNRLNLQRTHSKGLQSRSLDAKRCRRACFDAKNASLLKNPGQKPHFFTNRRFRGRVPESFHPTTASW